MLISSRGYAKMMKDKTYEELKTERDKLYQEIIDYENNKIDNCGVMMCSDPDAKYLAAHKYLIELIRLMLEKYQDIKTEKFEEWDE
jgi:hypothetical protein